MSWIKKIFGNKQDTSTPDVFGGEPTSGKNRDRVHTSNPDQPALDRQIRVFISSTFRDMQAERDILIKKIFPQLRKMCEERAVTWTEVDLRWGITEEESSEGKVLPLCLAEIERCRPYFIGLLGERYGWIPELDSISADLLESQTWLKQHIKDRTSVTELEILHGVFSEETMHGHAYFYFRNPIYLDSIPVETRTDFVAENNDAVRRLAKLKQKIRVASDEEVCRLREDYANPEKLGEWILEDFTELVDRLYPKDQIPDAIDQEAALHEAYAKNHRLAFVGREDLIRCINKHVLNDGRPLFLTGESGCGKSALLAEWVARWKINHPDDLIIQHYIGSTSDSADWQGLVLRVLGELKRAFAINNDIPLESDALRIALEIWVGKVSGSRRVILVLDGLNQLTEEDAACQLGWLPTAFPSNFQVILSSLSGESLITLQTRNWFELKVPLFTRDDIAPAVIAYFKIFSKTLSIEILDMLKSTPAVCNPLYLRAVLDELRQFGIHDELESKAKGYLSAPDLPKLFERILLRWEQDFGESMVEKIFSLIWASRDGLCETELLDLLGTNDQPLARGVWTPLHLAAEANFVNRSGLLNFANSYMNQTVECKFLQSAEAKKAVHFSLASFFEAQAGFSPRKAKELPWQYKKTEEWEHLWICLCDFQYLKTSWKRSEYDVCRFWREVEQATSHRLGDAYKNLIENPFEDISAAIIAGQIFMKSGYNKQSNSLRQKVSLAVNLIQRLHPQQTDQLQQYVLAGTLHEEAQALNSLGLFQEAIDRLNEAETIARAAYQWDTLLYVLNEKCDLLLETGKVDQAILFINEGITIAREQQKSDLLSGFLQQLAHAERLQGNLNAAHTALSQAEDIMRSRGNLRGLAQILGDRGLLFTRQGRYKEAWSCHEKEGAISRDLNEQHGIESSLFGQVNILKELGEYARALYLMEQVETLYKLSGNFNSLAKCFGTKAAILQEQGKYAEAIEWHIKEETMFREMGNTEGLVIALTNQAILLGYRLGQHDKAMTLAKEALGYAKSGGQVSLTKQIEGLLKSLTNQTKI